MKDEVGVQRWEQAARELADLIAEVADGTGAGSLRRKRYTRKKPVRRGHKRGPYAPKGTAARAFGMSAPSKHEE